MLFALVLCKRAANYDASLVFQDAVVKSTSFLFSPVSVAPDARQRVRIVPGFGFERREERRGEDWYVQIMICIVRVRTAEHRLCSYRVPRAVISVIIIP
jgi:hypothetical protein